MKKLIFSFFLCGATMFPAFSQTYQELSERAVAATEQDRDLIYFKQNTLQTPAYSVRQFAGWLLGFLACT